jgi:predicted permease
MRLLHRLRFRLRRRQAETSLVAEMQLHREMLEERLRREGMTEQQARDTAARRFGNVTSALEQSREQWGWAWLESVGQDLRYAVRALRRSKAFAATTVLTLGVGLGLNTVLFTLFNAYVLRPFAVRDPHSLYEVGWWTKDGGSRFFSWQEYEEFRQRTDVFSQTLAESYCFVRLETHPLFGSLVSGNYFQTLGVNTLLGRPLLEEDHSVVVISHAAWKMVFGEDPQIVGRKLILNGHPFEVIGVTRPEFTGLGERPPDFWVPVTMFRELKNGENLFGPEQPRHLIVVGRLRHDLTVQQAAEALTPLARRSASRSARDLTDFRVSLQSRATPIAYTPKMVPVFSPIFAAFVLVLLAACANVSNMMLARATTRQREIGVRLSLGAGRWRLIRQLLTESLLLAVAAGATGMGIAHLTVDLGQKLFFSTVPAEFAKVVRLVPLTLDYRVFVFVMAAAGVATVAFGLLPSLQATRIGLVPALRGEFGARVSASRLRDALVISQVTVSLVLLVSAAILFRNSRTFQSRDVGLQVRDVVHVDGDDGALRKLAVERLAAEPGVAEMAAVWRVPLYGRLREIAVTPSGAAERTTAVYNFVSPEYFHLFGVPVLRGRGFTADEAGSEAPVAIVSEETARRFWPGEEALGKSLRIERANRRFQDELPGFSEVQVIGIAKDVSSGWVFDGIDRAILYLPTHPNAKHGTELLVRGQGTSNATVATVRTLLSRHWPQAPWAVIPMKDVLAVQIYPFRAASWVGSLLGAVALLLTVSGMYGVMAYLAGQRTKEIGIRIALGATPAMVLRLVLRHSVMLIAAGLGTGLALSLGATKLLVSVIEIPNILFWDTGAAAAGLALVTAAALLAAFFPSRRASRVDPMSTLRAD